MIFGFSWESENDCSGGSTATVVPGFTCSTCRQASLHSLQAWYSIEPEENAFVPGLFTGRTVGQQLEQELRGGAEWLWVHDLRSLPAGEKVRSVCLWRTRTVRNHTELHREQ
ncbi:hypothetical protein GJAV_G00172440 [Gymnothorax javanicus]|nr:hypothetical protein GJAV_G00172440 [Gymnothorax javanicus]